MSKDEVKGMKRNKKLWIAWEDDGSIRSRVLAKEMNAAFYTFTLFEGDRCLSLLRYPIAILQTLFTLMKERPENLIVQNPSVFLCVLSALVKPVFNYKLIIDLHTLYIHIKPIPPEDIRKKIINSLNNYSLKQGEIVIITNEPYISKIKDKVNKEIFVLPDRIPDFDYEFKETSLKGKNNILFICSFSDDEPWKEVIRSAELLDKETYIYITGRKEKTDKNNTLPSNVVLTGFMPNEAYQNMLRTVDAVIVLTDKEYCLVCGGYEAVSAEKPLILSDTNALREYFSSGTVFTANNAEAIVASIRQAIENRDVLKKEIRKLKTIRNIEWRRSWENLMEKLG